MIQPGDTFGDMAYMISTIVEHALLLFWLWEKTPIWTKIFVDKKVLTGVEILWAASMLCRIEANDIVCYDDIQFS